MKYMLLMYWDTSNPPQYTPEEQKAVEQAWYAVNREASAAGVLVTTSGLQPAGNATTVRVRDGKTLTTDGPFAETHEQLGGYYVLECSDLDEAIAWAAKIPAAKDGSIEIRPLWSPQA
jgi:hypothetical protein